MSPPSTSVSSPASLVHLEHAGFGYHDVEVTRDCSLTITEGEVVAVLGPNGAGKSTLVKGLLGLSTLQAGSGEVCGRALPLRGRRPEVGYVPQRLTLSASVRATVREIVSLGRLGQAPWHGRLRRGDRQIVDAALEAVDLTDLQRRDASKLSGGQQRRVLIARALASQPRLLIMDEPTAGVDDASQRSLAGDISRLARTGVALIIVTHEITALLPALTRCLVVQHGRVVYDGPPEAALAFEDHHGHGHLSVEGAGQGSLQVSPPSMPGHTSGGSHG